MARCTRCGARDGFFGRGSKISANGFCPLCEVVIQQEVERERQKQEQLELERQKIEEENRRRLADIEKQLVFQAASRDDLIKQIESGQLPILEVDLGLQLDADEYCHFYSTASYDKKGEGQLFATNKRLMFLSREGGFEVSWKKVVRISSRSVPIQTQIDELKTYFLRNPQLSNIGSADTGSIYLELTSKNGHGKYKIDNVRIAEAIFRALVKLSKIIRPTSSVSRHIPQLVKQTVWLRDEGRCVNCGSVSELQFDHIIPHSKGGANTVENIQILCRSCNSSKRARV